MTKPTTMLDPRSRPTTAAERDKLYAKPDPAEALTFTMASGPMVCADCGRDVELCDPVWLRDMPDDSPEKRLAQHDPDYDGGPVLAPYCWSCARAMLAPAMRDYAEERRQCAREERLEAAIALEAEGKLHPLAWYDIAEANLGYCERRELGVAISLLCGDYSKRFGVDDAVALEKVRAKLWAMTPLREPVLHLKPGDRFDVQHQPGGRATVTIELQLEAK